MKEEKDLLLAARSLAKRISPASPEDFFALIIRQAIDQVLNTTLTGRCLFEELEDRPEKTFVGWQIEDLLRLELDFPRGRQFSWQTDLAFPKKAKASRKEDFIPVDVKTSSSPFAWMFPEEAVREEQISLLLHYNDSQSAVRGLLPGTFALGLLRVKDSLLNGRGNRDGKRTLRADKRDQIFWIVEEGKIPENYLRAALAKGSLDFTLFQDRDLEREERLRALLRFLGNSLPGREEVVFSREIFEGADISLEEAIITLPALAKEHGYAIVFAAKGLPRQHYALKAL